MTTEEVEERTCTCGAGHGSLEGHTAWCAWLEPKPKDFDTWWSCDGQYLDPDTADVPWFDKRRGLAEYAFKAGAASSTWPDFIAPPKHDNAAEGWTDPDLPNFRLVWQVAREMGYAVGLHGSMKRDCDMIAVPWVEACSTAEALIDALCVALNAREVGPREPKPNGRLAVNLQIDGWFRVIDLSIVTASRIRPAGEAVVKALEWKPNSNSDPESIWTGEIAFGVYYTIEPDGRIFRLQRGQFFSEDSDDNMGFWPSSQAARDAAQVDWNANLAPALHSPPDTGLREAAVTDVLAERERQKSEERFDAPHDDRHTHGELAYAAACYALAGTGLALKEWLRTIIFRLWPWDQERWKHTDKRRSLVKSGALILAEIERLDRAALTNVQQERGGR